MTRRLKTVRRVALLVEWSRIFGRGVLRGIGRYVQTHGRWKVFYSERKLSEKPPGWLRRWYGDGVIARIEDASLAEQLFALGLPLVDLYGNTPGVPTVMTDHRTIGEMAADHLVERGAMNFAYCGLPGVYPSEERCRYFVERLASLGHKTISVYEKPRRPSRTMIASSEYDELDREGTILAWLRSLPKPVGLMAFNDLRAQQLLTLCEENGLAVPEEVAIIGVDNDDVICALSRPPLTSIEQNAEEVGYQAAALLDRLMQGETAPEPCLRIRPRCVVPRLSTDIVAVADADLAAALHYIRNHATDGITIEDLLEHVPLSRRTLERRFLAVLGRSPKDEIARVQLGYVEQLLSATDYSIEKIAQLAGFRYVQSMCAMFKRRTGKTPGEYRQELKSRAGRASDKISI